MARQPCKPALARPLVGGMGAGGLGAGACGAAERPADACRALRVDTGQGGRVCQRAQSAGEHGSPGRAERARADGQPGAGRRACGGHFACRACRGADDISRARRRGILEPPHRRRAAGACASWRVRALGPRPGGGERCNRGPSEHTEHTEHAGPAGREDPRHRNTSCDLCGHVHSRHGQHRFRHHSPAGDSRQPGERLRRNGLDHRRRQHWLGRAPCGWSCSHR